VTERPRLVAPFICARQLSDAPLLFHSYRRVDCFGNLLQHLLKLLGRKVRRVQLRNHSLQRLLGNLRLTILKLLGQILANLSICCWSCCSSWPYRAFFPGLLWRLEIFEEQVGLVCGQALIASSSCGNCNPMSCICFERAESDSESFWRTGSAGEFLFARPLRPAVVSPVLLNLVEASGLPVGVPFVLERIDLLLESGGGLRIAAAGVAGRLFQTLQRRVFPSSLIWSFSFSATLARSFSASLRVRSV